MLATKAAIGAVVLVVVAIVSAHTAHGFGLLGHSVAGAVAEPRLCSRARVAVARFGLGQSLGTLSAWADRARYVTAWEHTAPWHYMNVPDDVSLGEYGTPDSGDVLWAIEEFTRRLGDEELAFDERVDALRFLVHFVVDIHQPLHVGRQADRGGNTISLHIDGERTNLHRLWDSGIIARDSESRERYVTSAMMLADANEADWAPAPPLEWAAESKRLREFVYDFDGTPGTDYLDEAGRILRRQLARAGVRLAARLNGIFCGADAERVTP